MGLEPDTVSTNRVFKKEVVVTGGVDEDHGRGGGGNVCFGLF